MLVLIETDATIPDKYKGHIKNQLLVIINGGSASIKDNSGSSGTTVVEESSGSWILGFIGGLIKVSLLLLL